MLLIRRISAFLFFILCFMGGVIYSLGNYQGGLEVLPTPEPLILNLEQVEVNLSRARLETMELQSKAGFIHLSIDSQQRLYEEQQRLIQELIVKSQEQRELSSELYEMQLLAKLGTPIDSFLSDRVEILIFELKERDFRGYIAKVKLFDPLAVRLRLAKDEFGKIETTSSMAQRHGAVFAVNAGGFFLTRLQGQDFYMPMGNTVYDGILINNFLPTRDDVFFSGFNRRGELIGGYYNYVEELFLEQPFSGASFVQKLMNNRLPVEISPRLKNTKQPRTILGNFANGDILFMVIDGRQPNWSRGATLEEIQIKLLELGAIDAYNLDGGGSSTMVFKGRVLNRPSDGKERPVATHFLIFGE